MKLPSNITPLIDGDWIVYLACKAVEYNWEDEDSSPPFQDIVDVFEHKMKEIVDALQTEATPIIFFTGSNNFRKEVAKTKEYKGNRADEKPRHYQNLTNYIEARYPFRREDNLEADDLMAMRQHSQELWLKGISNPAPIMVNGYKTAVTCIVTPDKDLRQVNGWHFTPEGHNYPSYGPRYCDDSNTYIEPKNPDKISKGLIGSGFRFFYSQLITGDTVDNIPGLPRQGPAAALQILAGCDTERKCFEAVRDAYRDICIMADDYLLEQAYLLWMVRGYDEDGEPLMWEEPDAIQDSE